MTNVKKLRFIHLSDIHFNDRAASYGFDPDRELRRRVEHDIAEMKNRLGNADAILISGDIAYAGRRDEFEDAAKWLDDLCKAAGCGPEAVFMCPGNHDVDQSVIRNNPLIQDGHDAVRRGNNLNDRDQALTRRLVQPEARALFYSPIAAYNEFAARYQSSFFADNNTFVWEHDFTLNDNSKLRLRGLNTALLSGLADQEKSLFLGSRAWTLPVHAGVEYMVMAHHPPSWLADGRETERAFERNARIQLFGHAHDQRIVSGRDWVKLFAGAVNPHRAESGWKPGYNIIEVYVDTTHGRRLNVDVHAREWQGTPAQFRSIEDIGYEQIHRTEIKLSDLPEAMRNKASVTVLPSQAPVTLEVENEMEEKLVDPQQRFRIAVFRFFRLSLSKKNEIVGHLRLSEESDSRLTDVERFKLSLVRARERGIMDELEKIIDDQEKK